MTRPLSAPSEGETVGTLIDQLISEQQQLSAVASFSKLHDSTPKLQGQYRNLIPLTAPRPGEQFGFEVDLDRCSGCKGCVTACHALNGLDEGESWREVGLLVGEALIPRPPGAGPGSVALPVQRTVTTACHHCVEPACLLGCPVLAYDKEPVTGIVRHLDDQCIGCSYCVMTCPYEVPKYSARRGIVRKCDLCHGRLADGEAPACVQACPNQAIRVSLISQEWVRMEFRAPRDLNQSPRSWLPDAPDPAITLPTTRYLSRNASVALLAADHFEAKPQPVHGPLVALLIGTQAGIGGMAVASILGGAWRLALVSLACFAAGMIGSVAHLGRPQKAWRVWLGWRTSWLSREAMVLPVFGAVAAGWCGLWLSSAFGFSIGRTMIPEWMDWIAMMGVGMSALVAQTGVYAATARWGWRVAATFPRFVGTTVSLGCVLALVVPGAAGPAGVSALLGTLILTQAGKLALELRGVTGAGDAGAHALESRRLGQLLTGPLRWIWGLRVIAGMIGGIGLPFGLWITGSGVGPEIGCLLALLCFGAETLERVLFFRGASPHRMPGMP